MHSKYSMKTSTALILIVLGIALGMVEAVEGKLSAVLLPNKSSMLTIEMAMKTTTDPTMNSTNLINVTVSRTIKKDKETNMVTKKRWKQQKRQ